MKITLLLWCLCPALYTLAQHTTPSRRNIDFNAAGVVAQAQAPPVQVRVAMADSVSLGYVLPAKGNETTRLVGDSGATRWFTAAVGRRQGKRTVTPALWVIKSCSFTTDTTGAAGFTHLAAEVYQRSNGQDNRLAAVIDTVLSFTVKDSTAFTGALDAAVEVLYALSAKPVAAQAKLYGAEAVVQAALLPAATVFTAKKLNKGVYTSYEQLLQNAPAITRAFWIAPDTLAANGNMKIMQLGADSVAAEVKGAWGVCFGGAELYKNEAGVLVPLEMAAQSFTVARFQEATLRKNQAMAWRSAARAAWPHDANPYERKRSVVLTRYATAKNKTAPVATRVHPVTGELTF